VAWHRERIAQACHGLFDAGGVLEDALDAVVLAAEREFSARIIIHRPAELRVDGVPYQWPLQNGDGHA
jgi:hypothetical protein